MPLEVQVTQAHLDAASEEAKKSGETVEAVLARMIAAQINSDPVASQYLQEATKKV